MRITHLKEEQWRPMKDEGIHQSTVDNLFGTTDLWSHMISYQSLQVSVIVLYDRKMCLDIKASCEEIHWQLSANLDILFSIVNTEFSLTGISPSELLLMNFCLRSHLDLLYLRLSTLVKGKWASERLSWPILASTWFYQRVNSIPYTGLFSRFLQKLNVHV